MTSAELAETALGMKNVTFAEEDSWTTFEVIENGELGTGNRVLGEVGSDLRPNAVSPASPPSVSSYRFTLKPQYPKPPLGGHRQRRERLTTSVSALIRDAKMNVFNLKESKLLI